MTTELPPFPVNEVTLEAIEHALGASLTYERPDDADPTDEGPWVVGADYTLDKLLDFLAGISRHPDAEAIHTRLVSEGDPSLPGFEGAEIWEDDRPHYSERDVIRALIAEVRRLRGE